MKNRFRGLSEARKLEMLQLSVEEIYNAGYVAGFTKKTLEKQQDAARVEPKSPNQRRAELIQRAREFVERKAESLKDSPALEGGWEFKERENPNFCNLITNVEFLINDKKRTVVALLRWKGEKRVINKGIAKCAPGEVYNADIGKAIAIARALEIEVPAEFLDAVQPDERVTGMKIVYAGRIIELKTDGPLDWVEYGTAHPNSYLSEVSPIIDDSHASYGDKS